MSNPVTRGPELPMSTGFDNLFGAATEDELSRFDRALAETTGPGLAVSHHEPIGPLTTYRVGGVAARFVSVDSATELLTLAGVVARAPLPVVVLGRGSNLLVADAGFGGGVQQSVGVDLEVVQQAELVCPVRLQHLEIAAVGDGQRGMQVGEVVVRVLAVMHLELHAEGLGEMGNLEHGGEPAF